MSRRQWQLDRKDIAIISALDKYGPKVSTNQLSHVLHLPSRTVRYRLNRLRKAGFLQPFYVLTNERKVGLGENIIVFQEDPKTNHSVSRLLEAIPYFYWYSPTYGKYNGHLIHSVFSLHQPNINPALLQTMQRKGLVSDYYLFEPIDYQIKNANLTYFNPEHGWTWNWNKWINQLPKTLQSNPKKTPDIKEVKTIVDFDFKDILIIKHMVQNATITLNQLSRILNLSEAQVSKRIQRLEKKDIIKGYKSVFNPVPIDDLIPFYCFLEFHETPDPVLACFQQLPHQIDFLIESIKKICIRLRLSAKDLNKFLEGFDTLKPHLSHYFIQIVHSNVSARAQQVYNLFDKDTNRWQTPSQEYIKKIETFANTT